ncbi:MAG: copper amine oxidase N-terminal domain-containing protein, partial [Clostridia bacterium]|nr:copper amine oxidase N-terminal domain-containing protein [Clostridia bacterium]
FIYGGTTYLPVRAVASALGVEVGWDGDTSTVYLGEQPTTTYWLLSEVTDYNIDGSVFYEDTYTYDEYGRNTAVNTHYPDDPGSDYTVTRTYEGWNVIFEDYGDGYSCYSYDENGNVISDKYYYGGTMTEWRYGYDADGRHISTTTLDEGTVLYTAVITYDGRGNLERCVTQYPDYTSEETKGYEYDASGYLVGESYNYSDGSYEYGEYYMYLYDDAGNLTTEFQYWVENGEKEYYNTNLYSYDEYGNLIRVDYDYGYTIYSYIALEI